MREGQEPATAPRLAGTAGRVALVLGAAVVVLALIVMVGGADLLKPDGASGSLGAFNEKVDAVKGPATAAFAATSGLGLLAGGAMTGLGMPQGIRMMMMSGLAGAGVVLGRGLIE